MLVLEAQRVAGLVPDHSPELGFRGSHREAFEVERRLIVLDSEYLGADIRPVTSDIRRAVEPGDSDHARYASFLKMEIGRFAPGIHVQKDLPSQLFRRIVQELHREIDARCRPSAADCSADGAARHGGRWVFAATVRATAALAGLISTLRRIATSNCDGVSDFGTQTIFDMSLRACCYCDECCKHQLAINQPSNNMHRHLHKGNDPGGQARGRRGRSDSGKPAWLASGAVLSTAGAETLGLILAGDGLRAGIEV